MEKVKWGIIGTGAIARKFAADLKFTEKCELFSVASRDIKKAEEFAKEFGAKKFYESYEKLLEDKEVDVVYISLPHIYHAEWTIKAARAKKHILCEKPLAVNYAEAEAVIYEVEKCNVFLMEAFMYRCHPQIRKLIELLNAKNRTIGEVKLIQASFGFKGYYDPNNRVFNHSLAGGGILDVGCYPVSISRLIAGVANNKLFEEPTEVFGFAKIGKTKVDEYASALLKFQNDIIAEISCGITFWQENVVRVIGTEGMILLKNPWLAGLEMEIPSIIVVSKDGKEEEIKIEVNKPLYALEADTVASNILYGSRTQPSYPAMSWNDTLGNMKTLDMWRKSIGLEYEFEKPTVYIPTIDKEPLRKCENIKMEYLKINGLEKPVSRLILGADIHINLPYATVMFDEFYRLGGNCFDTAHIYYEGRSEKVLGQWIKNRNLRDEIVVLDKGAHTPFCDPQNLTKQIFESLERLQTDYIDIYLLHRDNLQIPVEEFIDVLNEHKKAGRIKIFGCSNWAIERIIQANEYAKKKGIDGFSVVSNNFSLARMVQPPWEGAISSSDKISIEWFKKTQIPLFAWSSQARGFFSKGSPDYLEDKELVKCWYSEDNFEKLKRAKEIAKKKNVYPINIALAYVLTQKFPTAALIGPRNLFELKNCLVVFDIKLTEEEINYLACLD